MFRQVLYILRCDSLYGSYTGADWVVFCVTVITSALLGRRGLPLEIQRLRDLIRNLSCYIALVRRRRAIIHRFHTISGSSSGINASGWNGTSRGVK